MKRIILILAGLCTAFALSGQNFAGTYMFEKRDTCDLYLDVYTPTPGTDTVVGENGETIKKPTVVFIFGGGFILGSRNDPFYLPWFKLLNDNGYGVVSIDYRLGLKGVPIRFDLTHLVDAAKKTQHAVNIGVEDLFSAVKFLIINKDKLGIDPNNLVVSGSSAGAIISLTAEWQICEGSVRTAALPAGFNFTGVMSFAGAIMSDSGKPIYHSAPCPQLMFHGTADGAVNYGKQSFGKRGIWGSDAIAKILAKQGFPYNIYRYTGHSHDMASNLVETWPEQLRFLEQDVVAKKSRTLDATLVDPAMPVRWNITLDDIY
jgi:predicted esterase